MRCVLVGNFGVGNVGDEAIKQYYLEVFPEIEWSVLVGSSPKKNEFPRLPLGLRSLFTPWWRTIVVIWKSDGMVFGGGSLFTDAESVRACLLWGWHALVARVLGKKTYLAFQGIGPFHSKLAEWITRLTFRRATYISVRDDRSFDRAVAWRLNTKVVHSFDPVFYLAQNKRTHPRSKNMLTLIPRQNSGIPFQKAVYNRLQNTTYDRIEILLLEPDSKMEQAYASTLVRDIPKAKCIPVRSSRELFTRIAESAFILSERYHGIIPALGLGIPLEVVIQTEGDKLSTLRDMIRKGVESQKLSELVEVGRATLHAALAA